MGQNVADNIAWLAVDWGTSRLRAWAMGRNGDVLEARASDCGMAGLNRSDFGPVLGGLVADWLRPGETLRGIACGMLGSRQGWVEAPYADVPCPPLGMNSLAKAVAPGVELFVVPGVRQMEPADVMRGEETQIGGFLSGNADYQGLVVLPGTHSKWARVKDGRITGFSTFMTGEMFSLLAERSVLRHTVAYSGWDDDSFREGVAEALAAPEQIGHMLFSLRAAALLGRLEPVAARARLSGCLLGLELAATRSDWQEKPVALVAEPALAAVYEQALRSQGCAPAVHGAEAMTLAGLSSIARRLLTKEATP